MVWDRVAALAHEYFRVGAHDWFFEVYGRDETVPARANRGEFRVVGTDGFHAVRFELNLLSGDEFCEENVVVDGFDALFPEFRLLRRGEVAKRFDFLFLPFFLFVVVAHAVVVFIIVIIIIIIIIIIIRAFTALTFVFQLRSFR